MPEAISGEGGHNATFAVACTLVQGFDLDYDDALTLLVEYNERCEPPWLLAELEHKVSDALDQPVHDRGEAYLINARNKVLLRQACAARNGVFFPRRASSPASGCQGLR